MGAARAAASKLPKPMDEVQNLSPHDILGMQLVTHQTGPAGKKVSRIYVEEGSDIDRELYLSVLLDRATSRISFIASTEGGMDIEAGGR